MKTQYKVFLVSILEFIAIICYSIYFSDDPRMVDDAIEMQDMNPLELFIIIQSFVGIFCSWIYSLINAIKYNRLKWFFLILFIWPLFLVFLIKVQTKNEDPSVEPAGPRLLFYFFVLFSVISSVHVIVSLTRKNYIEFIIQLALALSSVMTVIGLKKKAIWTIRPLIIWIISMLLLTVWFLITMFGPPLWMSTIHLIVFGGVYFSIFLYARKTVLHTSANQASAPDGVNAASSC